MSDPNRWFSDGPPRPIPAIRYDKMIRWPTPNIKLTSDDGQLFTPCMIVRIVGTVQSQGAPWTWEFYFCQTVEPEFSLVFTMGKATEDSTMGLLTIRPRDKITSNAYNGVANYDLLPSANTNGTPLLPRGEDLFDIYKSLGRDRFRFNREGGGSLWHVLRLLQDLQEAGLVAKGSLEAFTSWLVAKERLGMRLDWSPGEFY